MRSRIFLGMMFGAIGGFLGFALQERLVPHGIRDTALSDMIRLGILVGSMLGIAIGAVEGAAVGSSQRLLRGMIIGLGVGILGGMFGAYFGSVVFNIALAGKPYEQLQDSSSMLDFIHLLLARALGWTFLGAFPGMAAGAATLSKKRAWHGLAGGLIGGFVGGILFDPLGKIVAPMFAPAAALTRTVEYDAGGPSRAIGFTMIGLMSGLFIGLVEALLKQGWVRVLAGRNEGKDYILSKPLTVIGRDERADIPVFGDPNLSPQHAAIKADQGRHYLLDGGAQPGSVVNGQRVVPDQPLILKDGDMIQMGQVRLLFHEKATASRIARPKLDKAPASASLGGSMNVPSTHCPFCGAQKDASGNCLCSVPGTVGASNAVPANGMPTAPGAPISMLVYPPDPAMSAPQTQGLSYGVSPTGPGTRLTALDGPYAGQSFPLTGPSVSIGRDPMQMIALIADSTISRRHAHINEENSCHVVYDDGSSNGTFVNNVRVPVQALAPGDVVQFGSSKFRYE